jgi:hypothetical protein
LGDGISLSDQGARFASTKAHTPEESLALPGSQTHLILLTQVVAEQFTVPQIVVVTQVARMGAQVPLDFFPSPVIQSARSPVALPFPQPAKTPVFKAMNPTLDRGGMFPKPFADVITAMALADQQNAMQPMVVTRFIGAADLLLDGNLHCLSILNLESFHTAFYRERRPMASTLYCITYDAVYSLLKVVAFIKTYKWTIHPERAC